MRPGRPLPRVEVQRLADAAALVAVGPERLRAEAARHRRIVPGLLALWAGNARLPGCAPRLPARAVVTPHRVLPPCIIGVLLPRRLRDDQPRDHQPPHANNARGGVRGSSRQPCFTATRRHAAQLRSRRQRVSLSLPPPHNWSDPRTGTVVRVLGTRTCTPRTVLITRKECSSTVSSRRSKHNDLIVTPRTAALQLVRSSSSRPCASAQRRPRRRDEAYEDEEALRLGR